MKRTIKFRGLRVDGKGWVYGHYYYDLDSRHTIVETRYDGGDGIESPPCDYQEHVPVKPETVGQFTGLADKNGVDIYEGDTIRFKSGKGNVEWDDISLTLLIVTSAGGFNFANGQVYDERQEYETYEVTGNIHENKELSQ